MVVRVEGFGVGGNWLLAGHPSRRGLSWWLRVRSRKIGTAD